MADLDDSLAQYSIHAIRTAAEALEVDPLVLAKRLHKGEISRLVHLLNTALPHVSTPALRHRIENLLSSVTDGQMPMFGKPESELDWALQVSRQRREQASAEERGEGPP